MAKRMLINAFSMNCVSHIQQGLWVRDDTRQLEYNRLDPWVELAQILEKGCFDALFLADVIGLYDTYHAGPETSIKEGMQVPASDPALLISAMAHVTEHLGLAFTSSVFQSHPFTFARQMSTLDHLTQGRVAWNVVTSLNHNQAANFGEERQDSDSRYERAHEFMEVCQKLWNSWDADALQMDHESALFADAAKVHRIEHSGNHFKSRGPLNVTRSPQIGPAILQAGTSPRGIDFAARYSDAIFAIQPRAEDAAQYFQAVKGRMKDFERKPSDCKILFGMQPIIGLSEAEAMEKQEIHNSLVPLDGGMAILSAHLDFDLSKLDKNELLASRDEPELQRMKTRYRNLSGEPLSVSEVAARHGQSVGLPQFVGTPNIIADQMEAFMNEVGGDGFMLSPIYCPGAIEEFVDLVVPELQRRGLFRKRYKGSTQRDHLSQFD